jgi:Tat protein secretion system quality control protein TatD with DNase activity
MRENNRACPCCSFDLFLPPPPSEASAEQNESKTSLDPGDGDGDDEPMSPDETASCIAAATNIDIIVDTHGHAQLDRDHDELYVLTKSKETAKAKPIKLKSITCAVAPNDWKDTLDFAAKSDDILPALGVHPWYLEGLPENWLQELEILLNEHPSALVGEIGLCKMARFVRQHPEGKAAALEIQRSVFKQQMILAAKLRRPVSVHCVNQHGVFVSVIKELQEEQGDIEPHFRLPPAIGMHSFTGTAHHAKELLGIEKNMTLKKPLFYFGFSHTVNYVMCTSSKAKRKGKEAVCAIPLDRLLVESDVHSPEDLLGGTAGAISYVAWARKASVEDIAETTARNGMAFACRGLE